MANAKLDVDIGSFVSNINSAKSVLKGLDAEMKSADATFKATGNSEQQLTSKTKTLNSQIQIQKGIADQAAQALKAMKDAGVDPMDASYQKLYATMMNATAGMNNAQAELNSLSGSAQGAAASADNLTNSVQNIGKKLSLDQVIGGIDTITRGLENAAKKAVELGQKLWDTIMDSAKRADDTVTMAQMYGIDLDTFQRMQKLVAGGLDTSVDAILQSQDKLKKGLGNGTKAATDAMSALGIATKEWVTVAGQSGSSLAIKDSVQLFWEAGQAIMKLGDEYKQESYAQALFGRGWKELVPLFEQYKSVEEYNAALESQTVTTEETIRDLAELNDAVGKLESSWVTLKDELIGAIAPALTDAATSVGNLLDKLTEYLKTDEGQAMLKSLGDSVSKLFDDLGEIDPESVVQNFTAVFETLVGGLQWIVENKGNLIAALEAVVAGWAALKITGGALDILKLVNGLKDLSNGTGVSSAASGLGNVLKGAASIALKAAPWLAGLALLLNPGGTQDNSLVDENGNLTPEASAYGYKKDENGEVYQDNRAIVEAAAQAAWDQYRSGKFDKAAMESLRATILNDNMFSDLTSLFYKASKGSENWKEIEDIDLTEWLKGLETPKIEVDPEAPEGAAGDIAEQIGVVDVPVKFVPAGEPIEGPAYLPRNVGQPWRPKANGIWDVPYDGYLTSLHKGERVMPAREVSSRSFSSNLYVENMNMGGGMSADALAATIAARNRRMMAGYGS